MRQRIKLQLEAHILDRLCQTQGCQFDRLLFCNTGQIASVFNPSEALDVHCNSFPSLLPDDEDITPLDTNNNPPLNVQDPITRARARQLNLEVSSFLNSSSYDYENRLLPNDYIVIRNHGEGQGIPGEGLGGMEDQQGHTSQEGGPNQLTSGLFLGSGSSLR
jgi:hypothetical protein